MNFSSKNDTDGDNEFGPRRAFLISYTRQNDAREKGLISDDLSSLSRWYNPGNRFERSVVFVPFGRQDLDLALSPVIRYVERARSPGIIPTATHLIRSILLANRLINEERCDVARVHGPNLSALVALPLRLLSSIPMLLFIEAFWEDGLRHQTYIPRPLRALLPWWYRIVYRSFDAYCGTPSFDPERYVKMGMKRGRIATWLNEIDLRTLSSGSESAVVPKAVTESARPRLVAVGRLHPEKRTLDLVDILAKVRRTLPTATLVMVGDGPLRSAVQERAQSQGVEDALILTGSVPTTHAFAIVRVCDIYTAVMQGSALVEAMAAAIPIVAFNNAAHRAFLEAGRNAIMVPDRDCEAMAAAVVDLVQHPDKARSLATAAEQDAWRIYGPDAVAEALFGGFKHAWNMRHHPLQ